MKKWSFLFLLVIAFVSFANAQLPGAYAMRLNDVFDSVCARYNLKGASAAIHVPNVGTWNRVHGVSHAGTPVNEDMLFGIGSNTKTIVATLLLKMQEQQMLDLDDTIGKWISNKPNIDGKVTIRQLLNHSSGIYNFTEHPDFNDHVSADFERIWKLEDILDLVEAPYFPRGTSWRYSNTNYTLAGIIIEKVSGKPMEQAMREMIFNPAGLNESYYYPQEGAGETIAHNWTMSIDGVRLTDCFSDPGFSLNSDFSMAASAGCVMQTATDNVMFWHKLMAGDIINADSWKEMKQLKNGYGLGIYRLNGALNGRSIYSHGGTIKGFVAENAVDLVSGICFSVLTNQDSIGNDALLIEIIGALHQVGMEMGITDVKAATAEGGIEIYPNPTRGKINLMNPREREIAVVEFFDMAGKKKLRMKPVFEKEIYLDGLAPGMYTVRIYDTSGLVIHQQLISKQ